MDLSWKLQSVDFPQLCCYCRLENEMFIKIVSRWHVSTFFLARTIQRKIYNLVPLCSTEALFLSC
jgi:hypothetical protein